MILSGEVEVLSPSIIDEDGAEGDYDDDGYDNDYPINDGPMDPAPLLAKAAPDVGNPFAHNVPQQQQQQQQQQRGGLQLQTILPRPATHGPQTPMIVQSPTNVSFENPAMAAMYEPHAHPQMHQQFAGQYMHPAHAVHDDKAAQWGAQMFGAQVGGGGALFTPPASSHGNVSPMNVPASQQQQQAYFMSLQRQQLLQQQQQQQQRMDEGAPSGRRERSGSVNSNGSGYASPASNAGSYEMPGVMGGPGGAPRRGGAPGWDDAMGVGVGMGMGGMPGMGMMKSAAISVGGGGNGHGYAAMML